MENEPRMDWTKVAIATAAIIAALAVIVRWIGNIIEQRIMDRLNDPKDGALSLIHQEIDELKLETMRVATWLEINKAMLATHGGAHHKSPFEIDTDWLRGKIVGSGYRPDSAMLAEFKRIVADPSSPEDDAILWSLIEKTFGAEALAQEVMKFEAPGETAPAIWILCIRKAQRIGASALLRAIGIDDSEPSDDGA